MSLTLTNGQMANGLLCIWALLITGLIVKTRLEQRKAQAKKPNAPQPVDPANPPTYVTVVRAEGDPETKCTCHGNVIKDGELALHWPVPAYLLCEETYKGSYHQ